MNKDQIKSSLQELIYRLQDAEKGYLEIKNASSNQIVNKWLEGYAKERHEMHTLLESEIASLGEEASVETTFLGELHRMFIDIKISNTSAENEYDAIVNEIERGATVLINDYTKILAEVKMPPALVTILMSQKAQIEVELESLVNLKEELSNEYA